jgi:hypothetical protein
MCDIAIFNITINHESAAFANDGEIYINASTSSEPIQYSINDGVDYQASGEFLNIIPGTYNIRVKDAMDCEAVAVATVKKYRVAHIDIPVAQSLRLIPVEKDGVIIEQLGYRNFDNVLFENEKFPGVAPDCYLQKFRTRDTVVLQFRTNYTTNTLKVYNRSDDSEVATKSIEEVTQLMNVEEEQTAYIAPGSGGQVQLFFNDNELPQWAKAGQLISLTGFTYGNYEDDYIIDDIVPGTGDAEGYVVALITAPAAIEVETGTVSAIYDIQPFNIYEVRVDMWLLGGPGEFYLKLTGTDEDEHGNFQHRPYGFVSEPWKSQDVQWQNYWMLPDHVKVTWKNTENGFKLDYSTGITHVMHLPGVLHRPKAGGARTVTEDSRRRLIKLHEHVTRMADLQVFGVPPYLAEKLALALAHDTVTVNDVQYQTEDNVEVEYFNNDALCNVTVQLRQVDFVAENADDVTGTDVEVAEINGTLLIVNP